MDAFVVCGGLVEGCKSRVVAIHKAMDGVFHPHSSNHDLRFIAKI